MTLEHALMELVKEVGGKASEDVGMGEVMPEWMIYRS
jgi:hypothetical protein